jgi:TIR domain
MPAAAPLQILMFRHPDDADVTRYENAVVRVFQGGKEAGEYLATGEDLGIQLKLFSDTPPKAARETLDGFCHTLVVVFADQAFDTKGSAAFWDWLVNCWMHAGASNGRHLMLVVAMDERQGRAFTVKRPELEAIQLLQTHSLGEYAIRPAMLALRILHECRVLLATALPSTNGHTPGYLRLFISHAKMDSLPLAHALKHHIESTGWLEDFYDVDDLPAGRDWQRELERGVGSSLIIMLRTEAYDGRHWCRQEVLWADEYATPAVLVDARTNLNHPAGILPFERVPTVRIPDGNLLRILFLALREGLRFLHFARRVAEMKRSGTVPDPTELRVFSFPPSMSALLRACRSLTDSTAPATTARWILYPDPPLRSGIYEAAQALVQSYAPVGTRLLTPNTLAATGGTP